jgi:glycosyltransferase involved in cell wall biosynthesis
MTDIYFAIPGDINALTGGYAYDRRLLTELHSLGYKLKHLPLSSQFPVPDHQTLSDTAQQFAQLPDGALVIADGLAFGLMETIAEQHQDRLNIIALCHHPLMLEAGLTDAQAQQLLISEQRALNAAKAVIVTSAMTGKILTEQFRISAGKIVIAEPGTDRQTFAPCAGNPPLLLTLATITRRKAHNVMIDALATIQHLPWIARFVGGSHFDLHWAELMQQKVIAAGLQKRITFVGNVADTKSEYAAADVFVLPSLFEGYGMAFAEALSFGLPIIAARAGAVPDVVPDTAGILVEPNNSLALADALQQLLSTENLRRQLQAGAQSAAQALPSWADTASKVAALIDKTIHAHINNTASTQ